MTDRRNDRDDEWRDRRPKDEEADKRLREERDRRSDELKESWRRNHPSEEEAKLAGRAGRAKEGTGEGFGRPGRTSRA